MVTLDTLDTEDTGDTLNTLDTYNTEDTQHTLDKGDLLVTLDHSIDTKKTYKTCTHQIHVLLPLFLTAP